MMKAIKPLADWNHPLVKQKAEALSAGVPSDREKLKNMFFYVRDQILFGFPEKGDLVKASETIRLQRGQCNTKGTLLLALCKAAGLSARIHFSLIRKEIQRGLFTGLIYRKMPAQISHSWIDVEIEGSWRKLDSFVNDQPFYEAGKKQLRHEGWDTGYSISCSRQESSSDFDLDRERFVQMDAVVADHGTWDDPAAYYASDLYQNRPGFLKLLLYKLVIGRVNKRVDMLRNSCPAMEAD